MDRLARISLLLGGIAVAAAIGLDAWHAHGLKADLEAEPYEAFGRGVRVAYVAGIGLCLSGLVGRLQGGLLNLLAAAALALGGLLFVGEVCRGALGHSTFGLAPKGGMLSMVGWILLGVAGFRAAAPASSGRSGT